MYTDKIVKKWPVILILALLIILAAGFGFWYAQTARAEGDIEGAAAVKTAVEQSALQCYAVEGAYPPNVQYLQDNYGLMINHDKYYVTYEAFSTNLPPTIKVTERRDYAQE